MASTYSSNLRIQLMANGEMDSLWGTHTNTNWQLVEASVAGRAAVTHSDAANYTLTANNGSSDESRQMILNIAGALGAARNTVCPTASKLYVAKNATTGGFATTLKTSAGTGIAIPNGRTTLLFCDGTNVVDAIDYLSTLQCPAIGGVTPGSGAFTTLSATGVSTLSADVTLSYASGAAGVVTSTVRNTTATGFSRVSLGNDTSAVRLSLAMYGSTHATRASTTWLRSESTEPLILGYNDTEVARITEVGVNLGGSASRAATNPTNALNLFDGTAPVGTLANGVSFYSASGEARVMDAAGNSTLLSPHDQKTNEWIFDSVDSRTGRHLRIEMERMMKALNDRFGWNYISETLGRREAKHV